MHSVLTKIKSDKEVWINSRIPQDSIRGNAKKVPQSIWFDRFHDLIKPYLQKYNPSLSYYANPESFDLYFSESTPIFHFFKISPKRYYINNFQLKNFYKFTDIDEAALEQVYGNSKSDKWIIQKPPISFSYNFPYVLYAMGQFTWEIETIKKMKEWTEKNKVHIVLKPHPTIWNDQPDLLVQNNNWYSVFKRKGWINEYIHLAKSDNIHDLIADPNCIQFWTNHSGTALNAILANKPTSFFLIKDGVDYYEISNKCKYHDFDSAYENALLNDKDDLYKWISWYYNYLVLDLKNKNASEILDQRLYRYYEKGYKDYHYLDPRRI